MKYRKLHLLGFVLAAALLCGALTATGASALESVFLVDGVRPVEPVATVTEGTFFIEIQNAAKEFVVIVGCEGLFNGTVATGGNAKLDQITKFFTPAGVEVGELAGGKAGLDCTVIKTVAGSCDNSSHLAEVWPDNLPWPSVLVLAEGAFDDRDEGGNIPGFDIQCLNSLGLNNENLCEDPLFALLENTVENDILLKFPIQEFKLCGANELGFFEAVWLMTVPGKTVSVGEG